MAKIVMIIAPENFRDEELFQPKEILELAGHRVDVASRQRGTCQGVKGGQAEAAYALDEITADTYDAVVFIGGGGSRVYFADPLAWHLAQDMAAQGKVVAAICIAPVILANAGLLKGKKATVYPDEAETIVAQGAHYTRQGVVVDGRIVTGDSPASAAQFGRNLLTLLK